MIILELGEWVHFQGKPFFHVHFYLPYQKESTIITLNIGTPRPATVVVLNIKQFNFTLK